MAFKFLTNKSSKIIYRSSTRSANIPLEKNIYLNPLTIPRVVKSKKDLSYNDIAPTRPSTITDDEFLYSLTSVPILDISDLVKRTFLMLNNKNGERLQLRIIKAIDNQEEEYAKESPMLKSICCIKDN